MKHRLTAIFVLACLFFLPGFGQQQYKLMNWKTQHTVRIWLLQHMHRQYDERREIISEALRSKQSMLTYRNSCRQKFRDLLGAFPEKSPLNPQITGTTQLDGYRIENIIFESRPHYRVTANFYIPDGEGPFPAALFFCGHEMTSKETISYQKTAALFALNGFAVLVVDPVSQGERVQFTDKNGKRILRGSTTEHTLLNAGANLAGEDVVTYELYDNVRSLDYLESRSEVDTSRIGCLGNSGGGAQTAYFIGYDHRIKVAAPCSNIARREWNYELEGAGDGCQQIEGEGKNLLEIGDFLIMFAPKPLLILAARYDFVPYTGTRKTAEELQRVYSVLGGPDRVNLFTFDDGHGISKPKREAAVQWFKRWLCNDTSRVIEPEIKVQEADVLNCTTTGQVNSMFTDETTLQQINLNRADEFEAKRKTFAVANDLKGYQIQIEKLLDVNNLSALPEAGLVCEKDGGKYKLKEYILRLPGEIPLPCLIYLPEAVSPKGRCAVYVYEEGKAALAENDSLIMHHMNHGNVLIIADLRGMGETREDEKDNEWKYYNREFHNAIISLHIGKPLVGQQVTDLFTLLDFLAAVGDDQNFPVDVYASGAAGPVALYAALFRNQIESVQVLNSIQSYYEILKRPTEPDWYSYVVPDVLEYFDLPDLLTLRKNLNVTFQGHKVSYKKPYQK